MTALELPALWGVMMQLAMLHRRWPSGSGSGSVTSSAGTGDDAAFEGVDERLGVDVASARHVDEPGPFVHGPQLAGTDDVAGVGGEGEGEHHEPGIGKGVEQGVGGEGALGAGHRHGGAAYHGDTRLEGGQEPDQRRRDASAADDGHGLARQRGDARRLPRRRPGRRRHRVEPRRRAPGRARR